MNIDVLLLSLVVGVFGYLLGKSVEHERMKKVLDFQARMLLGGKTGEVSLDVEVKAERVLEP